MPSDRLIPMMEEYRNLLKRGSRPEQDDDRVLEVMDNIAGHSREGLTLVWPEKPTCHGDSSHLQPDGFKWRLPHRDDEWGRDEPFRTCSYCGSIHPEDLLHWLLESARLGGADWKYGWPHKFYVEGIPNGFAGQVVKRGERSGPNVPNGREPIMGQASAHSHAKWYNEHLGEVTDETTFIVLAAVVSVHSGILWMRDPEKGLFYQAPYRGFQR